MRVTHKRLRIVSVPFKTAQVRRTIKQIEPNAVFFHKELGISADLPFFSRQLIHHMSAGIQAAAIHSMAIFSAWSMLPGLSVMMLYEIQQLPTHQKPFNLRKDIWYQPQTWTGENNTNPVNLISKSAKREGLTRLIDRQLEVKHECENGCDTSTEIISETPTEAAILKQATED